MPRCRGFKPDGTACERIVPSSRDYCYSHDESRRAERSRNAAKAGRTRPSREIAEVKDLLGHITSMLLAGEIDGGIASVLNQVQNTKLRAVELQRKVAEQDDLLERLDELERRAALVRGGGRPA
jgi:hypothetical protein